MSITRLEEMPQSRPKKKPSTSAMTLDWPGASEPESGTVPGFPDWSSTLQPLRLIVELPMFVISKNSPPSPLYMYSVMRTGSLEVPRPNSTSRGVYSGVRGQK